MTIGFFRLVWRIQNFVMLFILTMELLARGMDREVFLLFTLQYSRK